MTERDSEVERTSRRLSGATAVSDAADVARAFGEQQWLGEQEIARLCILVEEWVANLYDHGSVTHDQFITIELEAERDGVGLTITDPGKPFDPRDLPLDLVRAVGGAGAGIDLMKAWATLRHYDVGPEGNRLELFYPVVWAD